ncbi:MAG: hypothetical protein HY961_07840 [Ignavibacteriae bacterium]|nr:hypothetical protein [Ignavibacteriota bacterium]
MKSIHSIASVCVAAIVLFGCAPTKELTMYLQDLQVNGGTTTPPVHITKEPRENEIHIIPRISVGSTNNLTGRIEGHTKVNRNGVFEVDTVVRGDNGVYYQDDGRTNTFTYEGRNLKRVFPSYNLGFDLDFGLSKSVALSFGTNYAEVSGQGLWSYRAGLGFRSHREHLGVRFDVGWQWEELYYTAQTVVAERPLSSSVSTVAFYSDESKSSHGRFYVSIVFNTVHTDWLFNGFLQLGMTSQKLDDIKPRHLDFVLLSPFFPVPMDNAVQDDKRGDYLSTMVHVVPGLYFDVDDRIRFVAGARVSFETLIEDRTRSVLVTPFVQLDFQF